MNTHPAFNRTEFLALVLSQMNAPYIWGGKGEVRQFAFKGEQAPRKVQVFDCSGLVTWALYKVSLGGYDFRQTFNTDRLWDYFDPTEDPQPGDLCLYGIGGSKPNPNHVMVWLGVLGLVVGASGGGSQTKTPSPHAFVKVKRSHLYRTDFLGFRSMAKVLG